MPANASTLLFGKIKQLATDQGELANNIKALKGQPRILRLRVGDWRVLFSDDGETVTIINVAPRGSAYD